MVISKESIRRYLEEWGMSYQRPVKRSYNQKVIDVVAFKTLIFPEIKKLAKEEKAEILLNSLKLDIFLQYTPHFY